MNIARKDYEQFKQDVKSEFSEIKRKQEDMLICLKTISKCGNALLDRISEVEISIDQLNGSIKNDIQNTKRLARTVKNLSLELEKTKKSSETIFQQLSEALNMVMVQSILDRIEILNRIYSQTDNHFYYTDTCPKCGMPVSNSSGNCKICGTTFHDNSNQDLKHSRMDEVKNCPLCGAVVWNSDHICIHCGHKFIFPNEEE